MIKRNRYRSYPKEKKKKSWRSRPLNRSVHIDGERWGWEYASERDKEVCECRAPSEECFLCEEINRRVKIISPENQYFEIGIKAFEEEHEYPCGQKYVHYDVRPGMVKQYIQNNLIIGA